MTFATGRDALEALKAFLNTELATTHAAESAGFGAVGACQTSDDLHARPEETLSRPQGPHAVLRVERDEMRRGMGLVSSVYECRVRCEVKANEFHGARTTGSEKGDSLLNRILTQIIEGNERDLSDAGFGGITIEGGTEQTREVRGATRENNDLLRISFWYVRP